MGTKQQYLISPLLLTTVLKVLGSAIGPLLLEKPYTVEMKTKSFIFADDMIVSVENLLKSTKKSEFGKVAGYKANIQN